MAHYAVMRSLDWEVFVECYWDRKPVLFKACGLIPLSLQEAFRATTHLARGQVNRKGATPVVRINLGGRQQERIEPVMPLAEDGSFQDYCRRLQGSSNNSSYALIVNEFHTQSYPVWSKTRAFFRPLWELVGLPLGRASTTLFHGNYDQTPTGVHRDRTSNFMFVLEGRKRMRFWAEKPWTEAVSTWIDYEPYLDSSFYMEAQPGDVMYWPSSYYHVGENPGRELSTSLAIGIPRTDHRVVDDLYELLRSPEASSQTAAAAVSVQGHADVDTLRQMPVFDTVSPTDDQMTDALPSAMQATLGMYRGQCRHQHLQQVVSSVSLQKLSAMCFWPVPPPGSPPSLMDSDLVELDRRFPILWARDHSGVLNIAANGHCLQIVDSIAVVELVVRLNAGDRLNVDSLLKPFPEGAVHVDSAVDVIPATRSGVRLLLQQLLGFRSLKRHASSGVQYSVA